MLLKEVSDFRVANESFIHRVGYPWEFPLPSLSFPFKLCWLCLVPFFIFPPQEHQNLLVVVSETMTLYEILMYAWGVEETGGA